MSEPTASREPSSGRWGAFEGQVIAIWHDDGRTMTLLEPFAFLAPDGGRWDAPAGSEINGASIPQPFWSATGGPFSGRFRNASVVHDVACVERAAEWQAVHWMFYEACRCGGVAVAQAKLMYYAVYHFGPRWEIRTSLLVRDGQEQFTTQAIDTTPPAPSAHDVAAVEAYFARHDPPVESIPQLRIPAVTA